VSTIFYLQNGVSLANRGKPEMAKLPSYPVPALDKGLDIIEALASAAVPQSLADLAERLGRSSSELFRMLNCLERRGYLQRDAQSSRFGLSLKLFTLAHAHSATEKLLRAARGPMQALTETFRESCHLSVLNRARLLVVAQEESPDPVRLSVEVGGVFEVTHTVSGRLLLAFLGEGERTSVLDLAAPGLLKSAVGRRKLARDLATIRRTGVSSASGETVQGVRDLAVLVGIPGTGAIAALAVSRLTRPRQQKDETALLAGMRKAARGIASALGLEATATP
jgi:DNA-binding IclR family transcriptional regulator